MFYCLCILSSLSHILPISTHLPASLAKQRRYPVAILCSLSNSCHIQYTFTGLLSHNGRLVVAILCKLPQILPISGTHLSTSLVLNDDDIPSILSSLSHVSFPRPLRICQQAHPDFSTNHHRETQTHNVWTFYHCGCQFRRCDVRRHHHRRAEDWSYD